MPMYEYVCEDCGAEFEELVSSNAPTAPRCPTCASSRTRKLISACRSRTGGHAIGATASSAASGGSCASCSGGNCASCH